MRACLVTPAVVLKAKPYGESDKIVSFLTEKHGKITGIAKGAKRSRKRFVNSLEPFSLVNLRFYERPQSSLVFIFSSDLLFGFPKLVTSLDKISFASYLVEITDGLIRERDEEPRIFQHLKDGLGYLNENDASLRFLTSFELKLLSLAGYHPFLVYFIEEEPVDIDISARDGGNGGDSRRPVCLEAGGFFYEIELVIKVGYF